jgi:hypothetical protein
MTAANTSVRYVVEAGAGLSTTYKVIDTVTREPIFAGSREGCRSTAEALNAGYAEEFERNRNMLLGVVRVLVRNHEPETWHVRPSDFGASVLSQHTLLAECANGEEALALCQLAREVYDELHR